jgi:hypothetical protein
MDRLGLVSLAKELLHAKIAAIETLLYSASFFLGEERAFFLFWHIIPKSELRFYDVTTDHRDLNLVSTSWQYDILPSPHSERLTDIPHSFRGGKSQRR